MTITHVGQQQESTARFDVGTLARQEIRDDLSVGVSWAVATIGVLAPMLGEIEKPGLRCDYAMTTSSGMGCVVDPNFAVAAFDAARNPDFARHLIRAEASGLPFNISRTDHETRRQNRLAACGNRTPPISGLSCDEYPFASTNQGAAAAPTAGRTFGGCLRPDLPSWRTGSPAVSQGWSACYINASQNSSSGAILGNFYRYNRILTDDSFQVTLRNTAASIDRVINVGRNFNYPVTPPLPDILAWRPGVATEFSPDDTQVSWWSGTVGSSLWDWKPNWGSRQQLTIGWNRMQVNTLIPNVNRGPAPIGLLAVEGHGDVLLYFGSNGSGGLRPTVQLGSGSWNQMNEIVGTFDWGASGLPGLFARHAPTGNLYYYQISSTGVVGSSTLVGTGWNSIAEITFAGRWNGDRYPDVLATGSDGSLWLYPGRAARTFGARVQIAPSGFSGLTGMIGGADWDLDGDPDLLVARTNGGALQFYPNTGGAIGSAQVVGTGWSAYNLID